MAGSTRSRIERIEQNAAQPDNHLEDERELLELTISDHEARELADQLFDRQILIGEHAAKSDPIALELASRFAARLEQLKSKQHRHGSTGQTTSDVCRSGSCAA